ncbi:MAG: glycosyltransferase family 2 protein [Bizionia paragorgiae]|uniref:glycosyltransferase family 2 protein n=1 Tax=Bizionia paragorgiae TaxID=283786 RepID=UPI003C5FAD77
MTLLFCIITALYVMLIATFAIGFDKIKVFTTVKTPEKTRFSIIIAFRNEAEHLPNLLNSLTELHYPKDLFEIIFVDDDSDDGSAELIYNYLKNQPELQFVILQNERLSHSPKKDAITKAVGEANNAWIVTTDADCTVPNTWLRSLDSYIQTNACSVIAAPVSYSDQSSFLKRFQALDFLSLMGATIGGFGIKKPFMCNGANFIYKKDIFLKLKGFTGNESIASGDDIFLLEKALLDNPEQVHYLKSKTAIVSTHPQPNLKQLLEQRKRWAAKTSRYSSVFGKGVGLIVLTMNLALVLAIPFVITNVISTVIWTIIVFLKTSIDAILLYKTCRFYNSSFSIPFYLFSSMLYPVFTVIVAFSSVITNYQWKGRVFRK